MLSRLKEFFRPNLERKKYKKEFSDELNQQLAGWARVGALIGTVAWLDFAFHTDKQLHPEFPELLYFRLGLSVLASLVLVLSFIPFTKKYNAASLKVMVTYVILATSWFTGRIANDPNYVSGLQIVVMIPIAAPVAYWQFLSMQIASVIVFFISVFIYKPNLSTAATAYSMNNLIISYAIAIAFGFLLDRIRFDSFLKAKNIQIKNAEIEAQIKRVNDLKNQQDGDYFLTAQLLQPLSLNEVTPSRVYIDFLTEQKKKFQFRKWSSEIGGDISSAHSIQLRGKTYVVFINGDAMGKSIQGAGGALVLGTVFKSFLHRTQNDEMSRYLFPEKWLKNCYDELHHVMVSFDGRMLVSAVIGIIDEQDGLLYYINAEHPWVAVYRGGSAFFIENELSLHKLGMPENKETFRVKTFKLESGDKVFSGSDGRDDIALGKDQHGNTSINTDEKLFLRVIEKAHGELGGIVDELKSLGSITDDLSLVRIEFDPKDFKRLDKSERKRIQEKILVNNKNQDIEKVKKGYEENPHRLDLLYELAFLSAHRQDWQSAAEFAEKFVALDASDKAIVYLAAQALKLSAKGDVGILKRAADYAERLLLRVPNDVNVILNLADIERYLGRHEKMQNLLLAAKAIDPTNKTLVKFRID